VRDEAGVEARDTVKVKLELDTAPREVEVPDALALVARGGVRTAKRPGRPGRFFELG